MPATNRFPTIAEVLSGADEYPETYKDSFKNLGDLHRNVSLLSEQWSQASEPKSDPDSSNLDKTLGSKLSQGIRSVIPGMSDTARFKQAAQAMSAVYGSLKDVCSGRGEPSSFHQYYRIFDQKRRNFEELDAASRLGPAAIDTLRNYINRVEPNAFACLASQAHIPGAHPVPVSLRRCEEVRPEYLNIGRDRNGGDIPSWSKLTGK